MPKRRLSRALKRGLDVVVSVVALVLLSPVLVAVTVLVWLQVGRPILFRQQRPGYKSVPFFALKFRSMTDQRDGQGRLLPDGERITPLGALLRRSSVDELPQLWNVLRGDMSLVGPSAVAHAVPGSLHAGAGSPALRTSRDHRLDSGERAERSTLGTEARA